MQPQKKGAPDRLDEVKMNELCDSQAHVQAIDGFLRALVGDNVKKWLSRSLCDKMALGGY